MENIVPVNSNLFLNLKRRIANLAIAILTLPFLLFFVGGQVATAPSASAAVANCTTSQFTITAKHNNVFYFDSGTGITSGYAEYQIVNKGSSGTFWAKLENFTGGALALARFESATRPLGTLGTNATSNQYWYLTASAVSAAAQSHDVVIYSSDPSSGGTPVCKLTRGFTSTASTITAAANKVNSVDYSTLGTPGSSSFTATVKGQTGTIGSGPTGSRDVNMNPATNADFAVGNYRLSEVSYQCAGVAAVTGTLYIPNACEGNYVAIFTFAYISGTPVTGAVYAISPIMQIASGTQMKHTSTTPGIAPVGSVTTPSVTTVGATYVETSTATINGTLDLGTFTSSYFCYSSTPVIAPANFNPASCTHLAATAGTPYDYFQLTGLNSQTTYYFEYIGETSPSSYVYGGVKQFRTLDPVPVATTDTSTAVSTNTATLNGNVTVFATPDIGSVFFILTKSNPGTLTGSPARNVHLDPYLNETITVTSPGVPNFSGSAVSLLSSTTYYYEIVVVDTSTAMYFGGVRTFTTGAATTYTITFDPNGGALASNNVVDTATVLSGDNALTFKPNPNPDRDGYEFLGWSDSSSSSNLLTSFTVSGPATLYAVWRSLAPAPIYYPPVTITWPTPNRIQYPTPLSGTQLNANALCQGAIVSGTYTYSPTLGAILAPGTYTLTVAFTPIGGACLGASTTVQLIVDAPNAPTITWPNPAPVTGPYTLSPTQLNAVCSVPGTLTYDPALGTVLQPGTYTLKVTCVPTNTNYPPVSTTVPFVVDKPAPISITAPPVEIPGGTTTTLATPKELPSTGSKTVVAGPCLTSATISDAGISYTPGPGCSGKTYITVTTTLNGVVTILTIPVTILVIPAPSTTGPITFTQGKIWWTKSPNADSYEVTIWGESVCVTSQLSCDVTRTIGPKTPVLVIAKGKDNLSATTKAVYENKKPLFVTNIYFDTAKSQIKPAGTAEIKRVAAIIKKEGFTRFIIEGHTDSKGGLNNQTLSNNRSKATADAFKKLLPDVSTKISGSAFKKPAASNNTPEGMALNRRSEVFVW